MKRAAAICALEVIDPVAQWHILGEASMHRSIPTPGPTLGRTLGSLLVLLALSSPLAACDPGEIAAPANLEEEGPAEPHTVACENTGDMQECDDGEGTRFCSDAYGDDVPTWGECLTDFECIPGVDELDCGEYGLKAPCKVNEDGVPEYLIHYCETPLVLDFDGGPVEMSAMSAAPASFDISGAGMCLATDWPSIANPWLAVDLDQNGAIDGGHELFGSGSVLADGSHAQHGFLALSEFDGNADGRVDAQDPRFGELLVWRDGDGDRRSSASELSDLVEEGVLAIELDFRVDERCDARGNCGKERAAFRYRSGAGQSERVGEVVDVYLSCQ